MFRCLVTTSSLFNALATNLSVSFGTASVKPSKYRHAERWDDKAALTPAWPEENYNECHDIQVACSKNNSLNTNTACTSFTEKKIVLGASIPTMSIALSNC